MPTPPPSRRQKVCRGFTLIELLAVLAVSALLMALLLPALLRGRSRAQNIHCVGNLRQLGLAVMLYADEHEGRLPGAEQQPTAPADPTNVLPRIRDLLAGQVGGGHASVFSCKRDLPGYHAGEGSSYEWNSLFNDQKLDRLTGVSGDVLTEVAPHEAPLLYDYEWFHPDNRGGHMNVAYADGHVAPWP